MQNDQYDYSQKSKSGQPGFEEFVGKNNHWFFHFNDPHGAALLYSQAYTTESGRDNGIKSVIKNSVIKERYTIIEEKGKFIISMKAGNHQEIAQSKPFESKAEAENYITYIYRNAWRAGNKYKVKIAAPKDADVPVSFMSSASAEHLQSAKQQTATKKVSADVDDYLPCEEYSGTPGIHRFYREDRKEYYFAFNDDKGHTYLRSEGYTSEKSRDNGINSVIKNAPNSKRWKLDQAMQGRYWFYSLVAGNHQEIAKTCYFTSEAEAKTWFTNVENYEWETGEVRLIAALPKPEQEDEYLPCGEYAGHDVTDPATNLALFMHDNGKYYFVIYNNAGAVELRSEGYETIARRDDELAAVKKFIKNESHYETKEFGQYYIRILFDDNKREIGRSCLRKKTDVSKAKVSAVTTSVAATTVATSVAATNVAKNQPQEREDDYLPCGEYKNQPITDQKNHVALFKHGNGRFYFVVYKFDGTVRYRSEGFDTESRRADELKELLRFIDNKGNIETKTFGDYFMNVVKDASGREVGRSCLEKKAAPVEVKKAPPIVAKPAPSKEKQDDYLPCSAYEGHEITDKANHVALFTHENGQKYFVVYKPDGSVRYRSEGFNDESRRKSELKDLLARMDDKGKVETKTFGDYFMNIIKNSKGQEVGRSCLEKKEVAVVAKKAPPVVVAPKPKKKKSNDDDYLPCAAYQGHKITDEANRVALFKHENGKMYFAVYNDDDSVRFRSEGFTDTARRDSELKALLQGMDNDKRVETKTFGDYYMHVVTDRKGVEVGRSCLEKKEEIDVVGVAAVAAAAPVIVSEIIAEEPEEIIVEEIEVVEEVIVVPDVKDDYLPCKDYEGHPINDKQNGVAFFTNENGQFYFVIYKEDGSVRFRSEGFLTAEDRDKEVSGILKSMKDPKNIEILERGKYRMYILKDKDGNEVGRSCLEVAEAPKKAPKKAPPVKEVVATAAVAAVPFVKTEVKDKEDDYLPCNSYKNHKITDKVNRVAFFKHSNGQYYFVVYKENGDVRLRSEGFKTTAERDDELTAALKYMDNDNMYDKIDNKEYRILVLKDDQGREVGRSCLEKIAKPVAAVVPPAPAPAAAVVTAPAAATATAAASSGGGGFAWWWLLPLLLIPLFFLIRGCDSCNKTETPPPPPPVEEEVVVPPVDTVEQVVEAAAPTCTCGGANSVRIFDLAGKSNPKVLTRLGTNPEFGSLHASSIQEFVADFKATTGNDRSYLDKIFKELGYSGVSDFTEDMVSDVSVPPGTVGNIGAGNHEVRYARLNTSARDLKAYRIKGASGCDIHFMKTCGNVFFYCD